MQGQKEKVKGESEKERESTSPRKGEERKE
jgi:hypothetical protein